MDTPTIIHITHWKAGSQWIKDFFNNILPERIAKNDFSNSHFFENQIIQGIIYPAIYCDFFTLQKIKLPKNAIIFFVMRDLRDTLVSLYFSKRFSHPLPFNNFDCNNKNKDINNFINERDILNNYSFEEGMISLINNTLTGIANIQKSWLNTNYLVLKYEDIITNPKIYFRKIVDYCNINITDEQLNYAIEKSSFKTKSGGRELKSEDLFSHYRQGSPGDWKNYFTNKILDAFAKNFADILLETKYEVNNEWIDIQKNKVDPKDSEIKISYSIINKNNNDINNYFLLSEKYKKLYNELNFTIEKSNDTILKNNKQFQELHKNLENINVSYYDLLIKYNELHQWSEYIKNLFIYKVFKSIKRLLNSI